MAKQNVMNVQPVNIITNEESEMKVNKIAQGIRVSKTSKLDGIFSWSLQALDTCPGSIGPDGELVAACSGCYATTGNYVFPNVKEPRIHNRQDWKREGWADDMIAFLNTKLDSAIRRKNAKAIDLAEHFRWFDSGDCYSLGLAYKMLEVMKATPRVKHWFPTRMMKFAKFGPVLAEMQSLPNVMVRPSSDDIDGTFDARHGSTIIESADSAPEGVTVCHAYEKINDGQCKGCRACWNKNIPVIGYVGHGKKMAKVIRIHGKKIDGEVTRIQAA